MQARTRLESAFVHLAREPGSIAWLDAGPTAETGRSYLIVPSSEPTVLTANIATSAVRHNGDLDGEHATVFDALRDSWNVDRVDAVDAVDEVRFAGGWVGWFGYECAANTLDLALRTEGPDALDAAWFAAGAWMTLDHASGQIALSGDDKSAVDRLERALLGSDDAQPEAQPSPLNARWRDSREEYAMAVAKAQSLIVDGEAYQLCLTSRVRGDGLNESAETIYLRLRAATPSHHGSFVRIEDTAVLSASPEQFLEVSPGGRIQSKPIKGTRRRSSDPHLDRVLANELLHSDKEQAENVMIVDLMRNDLGRVAVPGTVTVPSLLEVESYRPVHQLVSTVQAQLDPHRHRIDAIEAAFPAGSMTGAPKHRAVTRLQEIETGPRGIYSGATGYLSNDGSVDLAMNIRCIVIREGEWVIGAGGGVTALSNPEDEVEEARLKAQALLAVLGAQPAD